MSATPKAGDGRNALRGQRLCLACFYNLNHQPILRDEDLGLFIVRCPECGQAAPLAGHSSLGRFERTLSNMLAGAWIAVVLVLAALSTFALYGLSIGAGYAAPDYSGMMMPADPRAIRISPGAWAMVAGAAAAGALLGMLWRMVLHRSRGIVQRAVPIVILCAAGALAWQEVSFWFESNWMWNEGLREVGAPMVVIAASAMTVGLGLGSIAGVPLAGWCFRRLLLPARLQLALPF